MLLILGYVNVCVGKVFSLFYFCVDFIASKQVVHCAVNINVVGETFFGVVNNG